MCFAFYTTLLIVYAQRNIITVLFTAFTKTSTSSIVLYKANDALTVPGIPNRVITGSAQ